MWAGKPSGLGAFVGNIWKSASFTSLSWKGANITSFTNSVTLTGTVLRTAAIFLRRIQILVKRQGHILHLLLIIGDLTTQFFELRDLVLLLPPLASPQMKKISVLVPS
jgi:hypothetical protein